jgi:hypothetical protein
MIVGVGGCSLCLSNHYAKTMIVVVAGLIWVASLAHFMAFGKSLRFDMCAHPCPSRFVVKVGPNDPNMISLVCIEWKRK